LVEIKVLGRGIEVRINQGRNHLFLTESVFTVQIEDATSNLGKRGRELRYCHSIKLSRHSSSESVARNNPPELAL
jgi:hypothetical protein